MFFMLIWNWAFWPALDAVNLVTVFTNSLILSLLLVIGLVGWRHSCQKKCTVFFAEFFSVSVELQRLSRLPHISSDSKKQAYLQKARERT